MIVTYIFFFLLLFISFYIPGFLALRILTKKLSPLERFILSFILGMLIFGILSYLFAFLQIPQATIVFLEICVLLFLFQKHIALVRQKKHREHPNFLLFVWRDLKATIKKLKEDRKSIARIDFWIVGIILCGAITFTAITFNSGLPTDKGISFGGTEGIAHLASIKSHSFFFPPVYPDMTGVPDITSQVAYDFLLSRFVIFYGLSPDDLLFRLFPAYLALLYGTGLILLARRFTEKKLFVRLIIVVGFSSLIFFTYESFSQVTTTVSAYDQKLYAHYAKEVDREEFIIYLPSPDFHEQPVIAAMTGRNVYLETYPGNHKIARDRAETLEQLKQALKRCNEQEVRNILTIIGSRYILSDKENICLASEKIRGTKIASKTTHFYILKER